MHKLKIKQYKNQFKNQFKNLSLLQLTLTVSVEGKLTAEDTRVLKLGALFNLNSKLPSYQTSSWLIPTHFFTYMVIITNSYSGISNMNYTRQSWWVFHPRLFLPRKRLFIPPPRLKSWLRTSSVKWCSAFMTPHSLVAEHQGGAWTWKNIFLILLFITAGKGRRFFPPHSCIF